MHNIPNVAMWEDKGVERVDIGGLLGDGPTPSPRGRPENYSAAPLKTPTISATVAPLVAADHSRRLAAALTRDLADFPSGPARDHECSIRRGEVLEGIDQIRHVLRETERADPNPVSAAEKECYASRLRWAADMIMGLKKGIESLAKCDDKKANEGEYAALTMLLNECETKLAQLAPEWDESLRQTALRPMNGDNALSSSSSSTSRVDMPWCVRSTKNVGEIFTDALAAEAEETLMSLGEMLAPFLGVISMIGHQPLQPPVSQALMLPLKDRRPLKNNEVQRETFTPR